MMNRTGLAALVGGAPRRGGLAHLAEGETVLPHRAMAMDPSLRHHAMASMARQGRDPMQYTMGARNLRNPGTGLSMFADLIYTDQGWVSADTKQAADFTQGNDFANYGTVAGPSGPTNPGYSPMGIDGRAIAQSLGMNPAVAQGQGTPEEIERFIQATQDYTAQVVAPARQQAYWDDPNQAVDFGPQGQRMTVADMGPDWRPTSGREEIEPVQTTPANYVSGFNAEPAGMTPGTEPYAPQQAPTYDQWAAPGTFEAWRANRNPQGKGVQDQLYGQAVQPGTNLGIDPQQSLAPNVIGAQIPVPGNQWGQPGTALGFASNNTSDQPSILNSGYQQAMGMPYGPVQGAGWGGQGGGIGSGSGGGNSGRSSRPPPNYQSMFNY